MKVLLVCDVLLDVATRRMPFATDSAAALRWCEECPGCGHIAWHTLANVYYLLRRSHGDAVAREFIYGLLAFVEVVATGTAPAKYALALPMQDFEDALQAVAAVQAGVDYIITRNTGDFRAAPIPAILPGHFIAQAGP